MGKRVRLRKKGGSHERGEYAVHLLAKAVDPNKARAKDFVETGTISYVCGKRKSLLHEGNTKKLKLGLNAVIAEIGLMPYDEWLEVGGPQRKQKAKQEKPLKFGYGHEILQEIESEIRKQHPKLKSIMLKTENEAVDKMAQDAGYDMLGTVKIYDENKRLWQKTLKDHELHRNSEIERKDSTIHYDVYLPLGSRMRKTKALNRTGFVKMFKADLPTNLNGDLPKSVRALGLKRNSKSLLVTFKPFYEQLKEREPKKPTGFGLKVMRTLEKRVLREHPEISSLIVWTHKNRKGMNTLAKRAGFTRIPEKDDKPSGYHTWVKKLERRK